MTTKEAREKECPWTFMLYAMERTSQTPIDLLKCSTDDCMAWESVTDNEGYCKLIEGGR